MIATQRTTNDIIVNDHLKSKAASRIDAAIGPRIDPNPKAPVFIALM
jgi:hypothetical protein